MMINHNISALNAQRHLFSTNMVLDRSIQRLSSGLKINDAGDDASGLAIAEKMEAQQRGLAMADQNSQDGLALYRIADGAMNNVSRMLSRMEELTARAANSTLTDGDRVQIQAEITQLLDEIDTIASNTEYNTLKVLNGSLSPKVTRQAIVGSQGAILVKEVGGRARLGSYTVAVNAIASAAIFSATAVNSVSTSAGVISINGIDVSVAAGESVASVVGKINAVNDSTGVMAALSGFSITLITGKVDADAANIAGSNALGYALQGSQYLIRIGGDSVVWGSLGFAGQLAIGSTYGSNAAGSVDGVVMTAKGNRLTSVNTGGADGLVIDIDQFKGGNGVYVVADQSFGGAVVHKSEVADGMDMVIDTSSRLRLQIGANTNQAIFDGVTNINTSLIGAGGSSKFANLREISVIDINDANIALKTIQKAIVDTTDMRGKIGAIMNRLEYTIKTLQIQRENMQAAQARIQDADMAAEMTTFTKAQVMLQANTAMLAQANARPQTVLSLLK